MYLKSISKKVNKVLIFRTIAKRNLVKFLLEPSTIISDSLRFCLFYIFKFFEQRLYIFHFHGPPCKENPLKMLHRMNAGSWKVIIPSSGFSMQGSREKFYHQVFSLIINREVSEEFPKSSHVGLGTIFISAMKTREKTLITRGHFPGVSRDFTHI